MQVWSWPSCWTPIVDPLGGGFRSRRFKKRQVPELQQRFERGGFVGQLGQQIAERRPPQCTRSASAPASSIPSIFAADTSRAMYCASARLRTDPPASNQIETRRRTESFALSRDHGFL